MLFYCRETVCDGGPALKQHWFQHWFQLDIRSVIDHSHITRYIIANDLSLTSNGI